jgi:hypothetical protein
MDSNSLTSSLFRARGRKINEDEETFELREKDGEYDFMGENSRLSLLNVYFWSDSV